MPTRYTRVLFRPDTLIRTYNSLLWSPLPEANTSFLEPQSSKARSLFVSSTGVFSVDMSCYVTFILKLRTPAKRREEFLNYM